MTVRLRRGAWDRFRRDHIGMIALVALLIVLSIFLTPNPVQLAVIFGFFFWPSTARQVRGVALSVRRRDYVEAARTMGASHARIVFRHVAPNVLSVMLVVAGIDMAGAIL